MKPDNQQNITQRKQNLLPKEASGLLIIKLSINLLTSH